MKRELMDVAGSILEIPDWMRDGGILSLCLVGITVVFRLGKLLRGVEEQTKILRRLERSNTALKITVARLCDHAGIEPTPEES